MGNSICVQKAAAVTNSRDKTYLIGVLNQPIPDLEDQHNTRMVDLEYATIDGLPLYLFWVFYGINGDAPEYFRKMQFLYNHCRIDHNTQYNVSLVPHVSVEDCVTIEIFDPKVEVPRYAITGKNTGAEMVRLLHRTLATATTLKLDFSSDEIRMAVTSKLLTTIQLLSKSRRFGDVQGCVSTDSPTASSVPASFYSTDSGSNVIQGFVVPPTAEVIDNPEQNSLFQQIVSYPPVEAVTKPEPKAPPKDAHAVTPSGISTKVW